MWSEILKVYDPDKILRRPANPKRAKRARRPNLRRLRLASESAALIGTGLFIASAPIGTATGIIGAVTLIVVGTVGCIETEA